jgi:glutamate-1-semialdehyde 2,1-aminomutase
MRLLAPEGSVYQAGTLSGNPVSLSAGIATLKILADTDVYDVLEKLGRKFASIIEDGKDMKCKVVREGSIIWLHLSDTSVPRNPSKITEESDNRYIKMYKQLLQEGIYLPPASREVQFLSSAHTENEIVSYASTFKKLYAEICNVENVHE